MKVKKGLAFLAVILITALVFSVLSTAVNRTKCTCRTDMECMQQCGGYGDPEPRKR